MVIGRHLGSGETTRARIPQGLQMAMGAKEERAVVNFDIVDGLEFIAYFWPVFLNKEYYYDNMCMFLYSAYSGYNFKYIKV